MPTVAPARISSERMHNENCYHYLKHLSLNATILAKLRVYDSALARGLEELPPQYQERSAYADLYTRLFTVLDENILDIDTITDTDATVNTKKRQDIDRFLLSIYANNSQVLERTFDRIKHIATSQAPIRGSIERTISRHLADSNVRSNTSAISPAQAGSWYGRLTAIMSDNFKPQHATSLATMRVYEYHRNPATSYAREYRFGTQGQRHNGVERVSPVFEAWLRAEKRRFPAGAGAAATSPITHVYINNLGRDRTSMEGLKERKLTLALEALEVTHSNIAVITLPADKGFMSEDAFKKTGDRLNSEHVRAEFLQIALEEPTAMKPADFHISPAIRALLFKNEVGIYTPETERGKLIALLERSFAAMGVVDAGTITSAQRQAVWVHFVKFELPNYILATLKPKSVNFSCKDAIDRAGVSSAYYNLMKSFNDGTPMTREEFDLALHAAPTMVKARGMNHHTKLIWNAVDVYLSKRENFEAVKRNPAKAWLIEWRDLTCPHSRVEGLLRQRVVQCEAELQSWFDATPLADLTRANALTEGMRLLDAIHIQSMTGVSGKRLLLEVVTRTPKLFDPANTPTAIGRINDADKRQQRLTELQENLERYEVLQEKLSIKYPTLQIIVCAMKVAAAYVFTLGQAKTWINDGIASINAAIHARTRTDIQENMSRIRFLQNPLPSPETSDTPPPLPKKPPA